MKTNTGTSNILIEQQDQKINNLYSKFQEIKDTFEDCNIENNNLQDKLNNFQKSIDSIKFQNDILNTLNLEQDNTINKLKVGNKNLDSLYNYRGFIIDSLYFTKSYSNFNIYTCDNSGKKTNKIKKWDGIKIEFNFNPENNSLLKTKIYAKIIFEHSNKETEKIIFTNYFVLQKKTNKFVYNFNELFNKKKDADKINYLGKDFTLLIYTNEKTPFFRKEYEFELKKNEKKIEIIEKMKK